MMVLHGDKSSEVSILAKRPQGQTLAVGYADGTVKLFSLATGEMTVTFSGHKSAVTALGFDKDGLRLASGSKVSTGFFLLLIQNVLPNSLVCQFERSELLTCT